MRQALRHFIQPTGGKRRLLLGTWQAVTRFEHRTEPQQRAIVLHLLET